MEIQQRQPTTWESPGEGHGPETEWGDQVTDGEYHATPASRSH